MKESIGIAIPTTLNKNVSRNNISIGGLKLRRVLNSAKYK